MMASHRQKSRIQPDSNSVCAATVRAVEANEQAIAFLQEQHHELAIESFGTALRTLNRILSSHVLPGEPHDQDPEEHNMEDQQDTFVESSYAATEATKGSPRRKQLLCSVRNAPSNRCVDRHRSMVFSTPISMSMLLRKLVASSPSYLNIVEMSISVMFNFALAHHLFSLSGQSDDPERVMGQALALYELTHSLQLQEGVELSLEYTIGTICNLGHIHQFRGDSEKSSKCFQHLLSIFCFLQSQTSVDQVQNRSSFGYETEDGLQDAEIFSFSSAASLRKLLDTDVFFQIFSHLVLSDSAAAAA